MTDWPNFLEKLRAKTDAEKRRVAIGLAGTITALIAVFWVANFRVIMGLDRQVAAEAAYRQEFSPVAQVWNAVRSPFARIRRGAERLSAGVSEAVRSEATTTAE